MVLTYNMGVHHGHLSTPAWGLPHSSNIPDVDKENRIDAKSRQGMDGWSTIDVFYGKQELLDRKFSPLDREWFSQALQDQMVAGLFRNKKTGFFVDLAANHPWFFSNTLALERKLQWKGLCIEANSKYWRGLAFRDCKVIAAAVGAMRLQELEFSLEHAIGGIVSNETDNKPQDIGDKDVMQVFTVPLLEILERNNAPLVIDYLSLDVEGAETMIMQDFPFDRYRFEVMTVERPPEALEKILYDHGYVQLRGEISFGETIWGYKKSIHDGTLNMEGMKQYTPGPYTYKQIMRKARYPMSFKHYPAMP